MGVGDVRLAIAEDEAELMRMARARHAHEHMINVDGSPFRFSEARMRYTIQRAILPRRNDGGLGACCGVIGSVGAPLTGSIYLTVESTVDSDDQFLCEQWSWVYPEHRRTGAAKQLLAFSKALSATLGMPLVTMAVSHSLESAKGRFFQRNGCLPLGGMYVYSVGVRTA